MAVSPLVPQQQVVAALAGDDDALGQVLTLHQRSAYNLAYRLLGRDADARDAVQEAFLQATRAIRGGSAPPRQDDRFSPWLMRIVTNAALKQLRHRLPVPPLCVDVLADGLPGPERAEPSRVLEQREVRGDVLRALLSLPANQRAALTLRECQELSYAEIAETLGLSRNAVEMLLFRARRAFREAYEGVAASPGPVGCPELGPLLSSMIDSELDAPAWSSVSEHLAGCGRCRRELSLLRRSKRLHGAIPLLAPPAGWQALPGAGVGSLGAAAAVVPAAPSAVFGPLVGALAKLGGVLGTKLAQTLAAAGLGAAVLSTPAVSEYVTAPPSAEPVRERVEVPADAAVGGSAPEVEVAPRAEVSPADGPAPGAAVAAAPVVAEASVVAEAPVVAETPALSVPEPTSTPTPPSAAAADVSGPPASSVADAADRAAGQRAAAVVASLEGQPQSPAAAPRVEAEVSQPAPNEPASQGFLLDPNPPEPTPVPPVVATRPRRPVNVVSAVPRAVATVVAPVTQVVVVGEVVESAASLAEAPLAAVAQVVDTVREAVPAVEPALPPLPVVETIAANSLPTVVEVPATLPDGPTIVSTVADQLPAEVLPTALALYPSATAVTSGAGAWTATSAGKDLEQARPAPPATRPPDRDKDSKSSERDRDKKEKDSKEKDSSTTKQTAATTRDSVVDGPRSTSQEAARNGPAKDVPSAAGQAVTATRDSGDRVKAPEPAPKKDQPTGIQKTAQQASSSTVDKAKTTVQQTTQQASSTADKAKTTVQQPAKQTSSTADKAKSTTQQATSSLKR